MSTENDRQRPEPQGAEGTLRDQREWLLVALSSVGDGVITTDVHGNIAFLNPVAQSLTGWTQAEAAGVPVSTVFRTSHQESRQAVENSAVRALREGVAIGPSDRTLLTARDGTERPIDEEAVPVRNERGEVAAVVLIFRDISERRQQERAVQDALAYAEGIIATLKGPFIVLDKTLRVKTANDSYCEAFRVTKEETEGRLLDELGNGQWDIPCLRKFREESPPGPHSVQDFDVEHVFPTIGPRRMRLNARRLPRGGEQSTLILLAIEDVTERSQMDRQVKALADLHRRKDEFLAMLSHELRNPLSPILNAVHLLRLQGEEPLIQQEARLIERQVGQLTRLVDDLLDVGRITTGRIRLREERLDMRSIVERAVESVRPLIDHRRHQLTVTVPSEPLWLHADPTRMEQVVVNLLNNAAKYTDEGGRIWLHAREEVDQMVLSVRDSGIGINLERFPDLFDLFAQADRSLDHSQGGLGIGLSLVQRLVEMHLGTVEVYSEGLGLGSEFTVRIPRLSPLAGAPPSIPSTSATPSIQGRRVLVVDDNRDAAETMAQLLTITGYSARTAYSGPASLEVAAAYLPDVLLLDIGLPGLNGYEVARRLRQHPQLNGVRLIAMTGYGEEAYRRRAQDAGFDTYLVKPIDFVKVQEVLARLFTNPHASLETS